MISVFAWIANASAGDVQYKIETFNDASSNLQIESIPESKFSLTSGEIRQSYQKGNLWIRVTIEKNKPDLILYFQNPAIDEIAVAIAAATEPIRMSRLRTCMSSWAITPRTSFGESDCNKPVVAHTTAVRGLRPVAKALGCSDGESATRGIGSWAR